MLNHGINLTDRHGAPGLRRTAMAGIGHPSINDEFDAPPLTLPNKENAHLGANAPPEPKQRFCCKFLVKANPGLTARSQSLIPVWLEISMFGVNLHRGADQVLLRVHEIVSFGRRKQFCRFLWDGIRLGDLQ